MMTYEVDLVFDGDSHEQGMSILLWAQQNCPSYINNAGVRYYSGALITFYFTDEKDSMWFRLKYSDKVYEK